MDNAQLKNDELAQLYGTALNTSYISAILTVICSCKTDCSPKRHYLVMFISDPLNSFEKNLILLSSARVQFPIVPRANLKRIMIDAI